MALPPQNPHPLGPLHPQRPFRSTSHKNTCTFSMGEEEYCNTGLCLSIGGGGGGGRGDSSSNRSRDSKPPVQFHILFPPLLKEEEKEETSSTEEEEHNNLSRLNSNDEEDRVIAYEMREGGSCNKLGGTRKKLRLTKEQSMLLEDSFRDHNTITSARKLYLAQRLNLRPRQVEVWFQNRRARTKLKQTEVDCEFLKKRCESLSIENRRLKKELMELRSSVKPGSPFDVQLSRVATLSMCPSCKEMATNNAKSQALNSVPLSKPNRYYTGVASKTIEWSTA